MSDEAIERVGRLLFGRSLRLLVARWVLERGGKPFFQSELIADLPVRFGTNCVKVLEELEELEMLRKLPKEAVPGRNRIYYQQLDHPLWGSLRVAIEAAITDKPSSSRDRAG